MKKSLLCQLACFADRYHQDYLDKQKQLLGSWAALRHDWWKGLQFFFDRAFFQGRRDDVSHAFRNAANEALLSLLPPKLEPSRRATRLLALAKEGWFQSGRWDHAANPFHNALLQQYHVVVNGHRKLSSTGKARDRQMVLDTFRFICDHPSADGRVLNIAAYAAHRIASGETQAVYRELDEIRQIGPKIASLFLRDLVVVFGLTAKLTPSDYCLLQPVDTWVKQVADKLGVQARLEDLPAALAEACLEAGVDPIRFNQGAWYLGAHSFSLLLENLERIKP